MEYFLREKNKLSFNSSLVPSTVPVDLSVVFPLFAPLFSPPLQYFHPLKPLSLSSLFKSSISRLSALEALEVLLTDCWWDRRMSSLNNPLSLREEKATRNAMICVQQAYNIQCVTSHSLPSFLLFSCLSPSFSLFYFLSLLFSFQPHSFSESSWEDR